MTKKVTKENEEYYQCEECFLIYKDKNWAEKCQNWCKENKSCNIKITKNRLVFPDVKNS